MDKEAIAAPAKTAPIFYGWRIVGLGFILNLTTAGIGSSGFTVFVKPMGDDLGWNRSSIVAAVTLSVAAAAIFGHILGSMLDKKYGARLITTLGTFMIGLAMIGAGQAREIWQFLLIFFIAGAFGLYAYPVTIIPTIISKWFVRKRGMALSYATMGLSTSGILIAPYANFLISSFGWRTAWTVLGITMWALAVPACFLFMKSSPEDIGLRPDGAAEPDPQKSKSSSLQIGPEDEYPWTVKEATSTGSFWLILIGTSLGHMTFLAVLIHFFAYVTDESKGFTSGEATIAFAIFSIWSLIGKFPWAFLADRFDIRYSTAFTFAAPGISLVLLLNVNAFWMLALWAALYGACVSGIGPLPSLAWANYYGRTFLGAIRGITSPVTFLSQAAAPLFAAFMYDVTGGYKVPFTIFLGIYLLASCLMLFAKRPPRPQIAPAPSS